MIKVIPWYYIVDKTIINLLVTEWCLLTITNPPAKTQTQTKTQT